METYITSKPPWKRELRFSSFDLGPYLDTREYNNRNSQLLVQNVLPLYIPYTWYPLRCQSGCPDYDVCRADDRTSRTWRPLLIGIAYREHKQCTYPSELHESPYSLFYEQIKSCGMRIQHSKIWQTVMPPLDPPTSVSLELVWSAKVQSLKFSKTKYRETKVEKQGGLKKCRIIFMLHQMIYSNFWFYKFHSFHFGEKIVYSITEGEVWAKNHKMQTLIIVH